MVLRLDKVLYGLKQVPRAWNTACLIKLGFAQCKPEHGMHVRGTTVTQLLVGVYVDDLVIIGANSSNIDEFKLEMKTLLQMFNLRLLSYYHGIEVQQGLGRIDISESAYAQKLLEKAGMAGSNPCHVPKELADDACRWCGCRRRARTSQVEIKQVKKGEGSARSPEGRQRSKNGQRHRNR
jgi:hypothetical protein